MVNAVDLFLLEKAGHAWMGGRDRLTTLGGQVFLQAL